jgi:hypothetical protein
MTVEELRRKHHRYAQLAAEGKSASDIADATGVTQSRVEILFADPAFRELVAHYRAGGVYRPSKPPRRRT